jgi:hypothetical protein
MNRLNYLLQADPIVYNRFKQILIKSKQRELFKNILQEGEEDQEIDGNEKINFFKHRHGTQTYNDHSQYTDNDNIENTDIVIGNKPQHNEVSKPPETAFESHLDKFLKMKTNQNS